MGKRESQLRKDTGSFMKKLLICGIKSPNGRCIFLSKIYEDNIWRGAEALLRRGEILLKIMTGFAMASEKYRPWRRTEEDGRLHQGLKQNYYFY